MTPETPDSNSNDIPEDVSETQIRRIRKEISRNQTFTFFGGAVFFVLGLLRYTLAPAYWGINLSTQLPTIISGAEFMIGGAVILLAGFWTMRNKDKIIQMKVDELREEKERKKTAYKWKPWKKSRP